MNPVDDFLEEFGMTSEKTAASFMGNAASSVGQGVAGGLGVALAAGAVGAVGTAAAKIYGAATKARDFRQMLSYNPDLVEHHDRDPRMFNQMFSSLRAMNPAYSADPLVAGTYLRQMVDNPLTAGGKLTESIGTRDKFPSALGKATEGGMSAAGGIFAKNMSGQQGQHNQGHQGGGHRP